MTENRYIAFLRGINISGKNKIAMSDLKREFEHLGFTDVSTYLNSGNVLFSSENRSIADMKCVIEKMLCTGFGLEIPVHVISREDLEAGAGIAERLTIRTANTVRKMCQ